MKDMIKLFGLLSLVIFMLVGCAGSEETKIEKVAKDFGKELYTVDSNKIKAYSTILTSSDTQQIAHIIETNDKNIKALMTDDGYKTLAANRYNTLNAETCTLGNYTMELTDLTLSNSSVDNKGGKAFYNFEAKIKFTSSKDNSVQTDSVKGNLSLKKENDQWKVFAFQANSYPKIMKDALKLK